MVIAISPCGFLFCGFSVLPKVQFYRDKITLCKMIFADGMTACVILSQRKKEKRVMMALQNITPPIKEEHL